MYLVVPSLSQATTHLRETSSAPGTLRFFPGQVSCWNCAMTTLASMALKSSPGCGTGVVATGTGVLAAADGDGLADAVGALPDSACDTALPLGVDAAVGEVPAVAFAPFFLSFLPLPAVAVGEADGLADGVGAADGVPSAMANTWRNCSCAVVLMSSATRRWPSPGTWTTMMSLPCRVT